MDVIAIRLNTVLNNSPVIQSGHKQLSKRKYHLQHQGLHLGHQMFLLNKQAHVVCFTVKWS